MDIEKEIIYEQKMDHIIEQLEEIILDTMINVLENIRQSNGLFLQMKMKNKTDEMKF